MAYGHRLLAVFLLLVCAWPALSQSQAINGSIRGQVTDPSGSPVADAAVSIENTATAFKRDSKTDTSGYYVFPNLPLGTYNVTISAAGFSAETHSGVVLDAGTQAVINAGLRVGQVNTSVEVTGGAPIIDPARISIGPDHRQCGGNQLAADIPQSL